MKYKIHIQFNQIVVKNSYITILIKQGEPFADLSIYNCKNGEIFYLTSIQDLESAMKYAKKFIKEQTIEELQSVGG